MSYYFNTILGDRNFDDVVEDVKAGLAVEGFGVPAEVDMQKTFKIKLDINFRKYRILGACNPEYALKGVESEKNLGVLLPCSVVVQENEDGRVEVAAVNPKASMNFVDDPVVQEVASEIALRLERVIKNLG
ncbi:DUF302 domain-containing protein [Mariniphaga anaerophila]|nr:DUF302 domain-containing protein [Mariniphaga anaerophila]